MFALLTSLALCSCDQGVAARLSPYGLRVATFPFGGRGLATTRDRAIGEPILELMDEDVFSSDKLLLTNHALRGAAERAAAAGRPLTDEHLLPLLLLLARAGGQSDTWWHYVSTLPEMQPSPLTATAQELELLPECYAALAKTIGAYAHRLHTECGDAIDALVASGADRNIFDSFLWAHGHVRARALGFGWQPCAYVSDGMSGRCALLPVLDLLNHSPQAGSSVARGDGKWKLSASEAYAEGDQVFINYGVRSKCACRVGTRVGVAPFGRTPLLIILAWLVSRVGSLRLWMQFGFALAHDPEPLAAFDLTELTHAVTLRYGADGDKEAVERWRRWMQESMQLAAPPPESMQPPQPPLAPLPAHWMRDHLFVLPLCGRASDKLDEAMVAAVCIVGGATGVDRTSPGVASSDVHTDEILAHLLRARRRELRTKLAACAQVAKANAHDVDTERIEPLRTLMSTEMIAVANLLTAIDAESTP